MKVTVKRWHGVATWSWPVDGEECCGICRYAFEACCPVCTQPGDGCPPGASTSLSLSRGEVRLMCLLLLSLSVGRLQAHVPHALHRKVARLAAAGPPALPHVPTGVAVLSRRVTRVGHPLLYVAPLTKTQQTLKGTPSPFCCHLLILEHAVELERALVVERARRQELADKRRVVDLAMGEAARRVVR
jgi:hypothetical protein